MIARAVFDPEREVRTELVYGEIRETTPPGPTHEDVIDLVARWSFENTGRKKIRICFQNFLGISELDSAAQPDVA